MTTTGFSPSVFGAEQALLDLADHYLEPGSYSTLKSGLLGYMTGAMARVAAEGAHHRNVLFRENFLNTASLPRSIYNYAKIYDYPVGLATPASCKVLIGLYLDEVRAAIGGEVGTLVLPRGQAVLLGATPFVLAGETRLNVFEGSRVSAEHNPDELDFPDDSGVTHVRTFVAPQAIDANGTTRTVAYLEVRAHQAVPRATEFQVISSSALETSFFRVALPVGEQLAGFRVLYSTPGSAVWRELPAYFNETVQPDETEFCYYSFTGDGEFEVYFSTLPGQFRPAYNSVLRVEFLTTLGSAGNFDFTGVAALPPAANLRGLTTLVDLVTQPAGGRNMESLADVKRGILRRILRRNNITIEKDLEDYLAGAVERTRVNDSEVTFIKRRDDLQTRLFAAFLLVRDAAGRVVPTNTASLDIEISDLEDRGWSLRPGTLVVYDRRGGLFRLLGPGEYPDAMANDPNSFVYCVPFLMVFRTVPFPRLVYYRNQAAIDAPLSASPGDVLVSDSFLANSVVIRRSSVFEDSYTVDVAVGTNLDAAALGTRVLGRVRFFDGTGVGLGYAEMTHVEGTNLFRASVRTEDAFDEQGRMLFVDSLWRDADDTLAASAPLPEQVFVGVELYYDNADPNTSVRHVERGGRVFQLVQCFKTAESVSLYRSLERVMAGRMHVTSAGTFHCDGVPLVGASFFLNARIGAEVMEVVEAFHSAVFDVFDLLQNNTSVDIKLYNSYGPSLTYSLDRVNVSLELQVRPRGLPTEELRKAVVDETTAFVAECNNNERARLSISNLMTRLETRIPGVSYVKFVSLNGVAAQNAESIFSRAALEQDNKRTPEFINVATVLRNALDREPYVPDVQVTFI